MLQIRDLLKYVFQSSFGCEHMISSDTDVISYIRREYESVKADGEPRTDELDGAYARVHLSWLNGGLRPETLGWLFLHSAKKEKNGREVLTEKLNVAGEMIREGALPLDAEAFFREVIAWRDAGYPAVRHSEIFRAAYRPAYRVIAIEYVRLLPLLSEIDRALDLGRSVFVTGCAATLAQTLSSLYSDCSAVRILPASGKGSTGEIAGSPWEAKYFPEIAPSLCLYVTAR